MFIGCETPILGCDICHLNVSAPNLEIDQNGYYHLKFLGGYNTDYNEYHEFDYIQTFTTLKADIGLSEKKVGWATNKMYSIEHMGNDYWTELVNKHTYSDDEGIAYTVLGIWEEFIGDTITVYCGYEDMCALHYIDSLKVIIE